jgi:glutaredoxin
LSPVITVYSRPHCQPCSAVYRWLDKHGFKGAYKVVDTSLDEPLAQSLRDAGWTQSPVIDIDGHRFSGFDVNELARLKQ